MDFSSDISGSNCNFSETFFLKGPSEVCVCGRIKVMVYPVCGVAEHGSHIVGPSEVCLWKG